MERFMKLFSPIRSFFRTVVMVHKIVYVRHFNRARKQKKWSVYYISRRAYNDTTLYKRIAGDWYIWLEHDN